jgi:uncharacterized membrane protein
MMGNSPWPLARFAKDKAGNIAIMAAISMPVVIGAVALGVDYGALTLQYRNAQTTADLASIEATWDAAHAQEAVRKFLANNQLNYAIETENGAVLPDGRQITTEQLSDLGLTVLKVEPGMYQPDPSLAVEDRFSPTSFAPDAVRVTAKQRAELYFASTFAKRFDFQVSGTAAASKQASFWIGSRLASLNGGIINAVLGALVGANVSLQVADYQALVDANVDLFAFSETLATELRLTGVTYDDVLKQEVSLPQILSAIAATKGVSSKAQNALRALEIALGAVKVRVKLADLIDFGAIGANRLGNHQSLAAYGNIMQLVTSAAALANGERQADISLALTVPGLASTKLRLAIGQPAEHSPTFASGGPETFVRTAQIRLSLVTEIAGLADLLGTRIRLPLFIEAADAQANLASLSCNGSMGSTGAVVLAVTPGLAQAAIGEFDENRFDSFSSTISIGRATLVQTPLLKIDGSADVDIGNQSATRIHFSANDIANRTVKTVSTRDVAGSLTSTLIGRLSLDVKTLGLTLSTPTTLQAALAKTLSSAAAPIDAVVYNTLLTLGVRVGEADVGVTGLKCGAPVLVQ